SRYVSCRSPHAAAMAPGRACACSSNSSCARQSGSFRLGPTPNTSACSLISHLFRRVAAPPRLCWDLLSLHEKGVGGEHRAVTHRHAVVDQCANTDRAAGANHGAVAFECAVFLRVALDLAPVIEDRLIPDRGEGRLGDVDAVVEDTPPDPNTHQPPEHV